MNYVFSVELIKLLDINVHDTKSPFEYAHANLRGPAKTKTHRSRKYLFRI